MKRWPADAVVMRAVGSLKGYAANSRLHDQHQVAQIAASIRQWGWTNPVLIDEAGQVIAGHGRLLAARQLNLSEVPCIIATGWTDDEKKAYVIADNKLALNASWDEALLTSELSALKDSGFDLDVIGFSAEELDVLLALPDFSAASEDEQGRLDQLSPKFQTCPSCGHTWDVRGSDEA